MLRFNDELYKDGSQHVSAAVDMGRPLTGDRTVSEDDIDDFLSKYELLDAVYRHNIIDQDMAEDAFSYELEKALKDERVIKYLRGLATRRV